MTFYQLTGSLDTISDTKVKATNHDFDAGGKQKSESVVDVIKLMSDDKSLLIFNTIFLASGDNSESLRAQLKLTKKQYYSRISRLIKAGLVKRQKGRYFVTAFGKVVYNAQKLLGTAAKNYWKLRAIDTLGVANDDIMPKQERRKIIDIMIGNLQIREILLSTDF
jgi:DNA-binding HxlR family transcriptional regulator